MRIFSSKHLAYTLIFIGIGLGATTLAVRQRQPAVSQLPASVASQSQPSAVKPSTKAVASYDVPPANPKYIAIPAIDLSKTRVVGLGVTAANQIAAPTSIYDAGWYNQSAPPGQAGAMFIYGHVSNWQANGIFYNLKKLKPGDSISVTRGDDKTYTYKVISSQVYPYDQVDMNKALAPVDPAQPGLNLMTCSGSVIKGTSEFSERLVVFTSLVD